MPSFCVYFNFLYNYYEFGYELYNWIPGSLLVKEAGGWVSDMQGNEFTWGTSGIIATNASINQEIIQELKLFNKYKKN
ncbi:inositol monophosphatase family protein [Bacillus paranthracis]|uniref:inositol monophosphatase family protein n=1 Tax=Bacillus paranthracis TaxID=2026186 RepID=UPI0021CEAFC5|nr:inositol monophosphatase family protein [Bacillus paranthracis]MCU5174640.1 hypothetical protein [Bacillus paranthracis]